MGTSCPARPERAAPADPDHRSPTDEALRLPVSFAPDRLRPAGPRPSPERALGLALDTVAALAGAAVAAGAAGGGFDRVGVARWVAALAGAVAALTVGRAGGSVARSVPVALGVVGLALAALLSGGDGVPGAVVGALGLVVVGRLVLAARAEAHLAGVVAASEAVLAHRATRDELTGLPNRATGMRWLDGFLGEDQPVAVVVFDIDRLTLLNDTLGYTMGDHVIVELSRRLDRVVATGPGAATAEGRFTARHEGDGLFAVLPGARGVVAAREVAEAAVEASEAPITLPDGTEVVVTVSAGIALSGLGETAEHLVAGAGLALNRAKQRGRDRVEVLDDSLRSHSEQRVRREQDLRRALTRHGEIEVWSQPVIELATGRPVGAEALVRWRHPYAGVLEPREFLGAAEETGLIVDMGTVVLERACAALRAGALPWVAVNLSARELYDPGLLPRVRRALDRAGVEPGRLCIEVNEQVLLDAPMLAVLKSLEALGVGLAIDDFGVGASSLLQLQMLRAPLLKIDRSFVAHLSTARAERADAVIGTIAALAEQVCVDVVAEGVENEEQLERLRAHRIRYAQGYLFGRPAPLDAAPTPGQARALAGGG